MSIAQPYLSSPTGTHSNRTNGHIRLEGFKSAIVSSCHNMGAEEHIVQFYDRDEALVESVTDFVDAGLRGSEACIVIATAQHRESFESALEARGLDMETARRAGAYISL